MKDYMGIANSGIFYVLAAIIISFVLVQSIIFLVMAVRKGNKLGLTKEHYRKAFVSGASVTIVPAIAVLIGIFSLAPVMGTPIIWARLSIIGGLMVEAAAASIGATAAGATSLGGAGYTSIAFASSVWAMTIGTMWYLLSTTFLLKKIKNNVSKKANRDRKWGSILPTTIIIALLSTFYMKPIVFGGQELITLLSSSCIMFVFFMLMKRYKDSQFLKQFAMPLSMVGGMAFIVFYTMIR
jgi:hypothetical protein